MNFSSNKKENIDYRQRRLSFSIEKDVDGITADA